MLYWFIGFLLATEQSKDNAIRFPILADDDDDAWEQAWQVSAHIAPSHSFSVHRPDGTEAMTVRESQGYEEATSVKVFMIDSGGESDGASGSGA